MPDLTPDGPELPVVDPLTLPQYRVSAYFASNVTPPHIADELAEQLPADDHLQRDQIVEAFAARTDLQRIVVEERSEADFNVNTTNSAWKVWRTWDRTDDGHGWSHS